MRVIYYLILIFYTGSTLGLIKGSDTALSVEDSVTFPAADTNNTMTGFAWFKNGFNLEDATTSCTFDALYPVSGNINLNSGILYLLRDLKIVNPANIITMGSIYGNGNSFDLDSTSTIIRFAESGNILKDTIVYFDRDCTFSSTVYVQGDCIINGNGNKLILDSTANVVVQPNATLHLMNVFIEEVGSENIRCLDDSGKIILEDVYWHQSSDYTFTRGTLEFERKVKFSGPYTFAYDAQFTSTINNYAKWKICGGMTFSVGRKEANGREPLYFEGNEAILKMENCTFSITPSGMQIDRGTFAFDKDVRVELHSTDTTNGLVLGDGFSPEGAFDLYPSAKVVFSSGHMVYNSIVPTAIKARSKTTRMVREPGSYFYIMRDASTADMSVFSGTGTELTIGDNVLVQYTNVNVVSENWDFDFTGTVATAFSFLLDSNDSIFFSRGTLPVAIIINNTGNKIHGTGSISGPVTLQSSATDLTIELNGAFLSNISLNSGAVTLAGNICFGAGSNFVGPGTVDIASYDLFLGPGDLTITESLNYSSNGGDIKLNSNLDLFSTWTVSGDMSLTGNGKTIDFNQIGKIVVDSNATLRLNNIRFKGVVNGSIECVDDTAKIILNEVSLKLFGDYTFSKGSISFVNYNEISGEYTFLYDSNMSSTVQQKSMLRVFDNLTMSLGKKTPTSANPMYFVDNSSILKLEDCTLNITPSGLMMDRGTFAFDQDVSVNINSTDTTNGLILGDGYSPEGAFDFYPGAKITLGSGYVVYDAIRPDALQSRSRNTRIIREVGNSFIINKNAVISDVTIDSGVGTELQLADGVILEYENIGVVSKDWEFEFTGTIYDSVTLLLDGDDSISLSKGNMPFAVLVDGPGNEIAGVGCYVSPIMLLDSNATLTININGCIQSDITLSGGMATLRKNILLEMGAIVNGPGKFRLNNMMLEFDSKPSTWTTPIYWDSGNNGAISFNNKVSLSSTWTFSGNCTIHGYGYQLDLGTLGEIVVEQGSTLTLRDMIITNISDERIKCLDDAGLLMLHNVVWVQNGDVQFNKGGLHWHEYANLKGDYVFAYGSRVTSTICENSDLVLDDGITFSYDPVSAVNNLIEFEGNTSKLILDRSKLHATLSGLQLTKGYMRVIGDATLCSEGIMQLGNDVAEDDIKFEILAGNKLKVGHGKFEYRNVNPSSWYMNNCMAELNILSNTELKLYQNLDVSMGQLRFGANSTLLRKNGVSLIGSIIPEGMVTYKVFL